MSLNYWQDYYYYADNYNYSENYLHDYGLNQLTALQCGIGFGVTALISLVLYIRLLFVIFHDNDLNKLSSYRIILQNGYADCLMLLLWILSAISSIVLSTFNPIFIKICGAMYQFGVYSGSSFVLLLSFNRFINIIFDSRIDEIFGKKQTTIYIIVCWLTSLPMPISYLTPFATVRYYSYWLDWSYKTYNGRRTTLKSVDDYFLLVKVTIATILYFLTIIYILFKRHKVTNIEVRLSLQTMLDAIFRMAGDIYNRYFSPVGPGLLYGSIIQNALILLGFCLNAYVYPMFNKSLRKNFIPKVLRTKCCKSGMMVTRVEVLKQTTIKVTVMPKPK